MTALQALKKYFGYDSFRGGQSDLVESILQSRDTVGIMPTGAGKSICFQLPSLLLDGITLVVSPLISLMKDQVGALIQSGIPAAYINSSLSLKQNEMALQNAINGKYKIIYVAPERLLSDDFLRFALSAKISMLTVDEAHCISQWGQDFRPSYTQIPQFISKLNNKPIISAFTATATPKVCDDIVSTLQLSEPFILVSGYDRANLYFEIQAPKNKIEALKSFLDGNKDKSGIIYCATRKNVDQLCCALNEEGYKALPYHAGLLDWQRHQNQDDFLYDRAQIMVATNAFGMGIDKSNVNFVVHFNMPKDIESYYQEAGRAGRDGTNATCLLLYSGQDVRTNQWLIENGKDKSDRDTQGEQIIKEQEYRRLKEMTFYSTTNSCLRSYILKYFGESPPGFCGNCSNCNTNFETVDVTIDCQQILSCVARMKNPYGVALLIDVLRGSKNEKIRNLGFEKLSTYGISQRSMASLRSIVDELLIEGYLQKSDSQYPVIYLTDKADSILRGEKSITIKLAKEKIKSATLSQVGGELSQDKWQLLGTLKELRTKLAREQGVPAYVIFADSSLMDMCKKLPTTKTEFLAVSGVGEQRLNKYGQEFIVAITEFCNDKGISQGEEKPKQSRKRVVDFVIPSQDVLDTIEVSDEKIQVSAISANINEVLNKGGRGIVSAVKISNWLLKKGFLYLVNKEKGTYKIPTDEGVAQGISTQRRERRGEEIFVNFYPKAIQQLIIANIADILELDGE